MPRLQENKASHSHHWPPKVKLRIPDLGDSLLTRGQALGATRGKLRDNWWQDYAQRMWSTLAGPKARVTVLALTLLAFVGAAVINWRKTSPSSKVTTSDRPQAEWRNSQPSMEASPNASDELASDEAKPESSASVTAVFSESTGQNDGSADPTVPHARFEGRLDAPEAELTHETERTTPR